MLATGSFQLDAPPDQCVVYRQNGGEAEFFQFRFIGRLTEHRFILGQKLRGGIVKVVAMRVGQQDRIQDFQIIGGGG